MKQLDFRWRWILLFWVVTIITGCDSSNDDQSDDEDNFVELSIFVVDDKTNLPLDKAHVTITQDGNELIAMDTNVDGFLGINTYHGLKPGKVTIEVILQEYATYTESLTLQPGYHEHTVRLGEKQTPMTARLDYVEDLYGRIEIFIPKHIPYIRVSEGMEYNPNNYSEYTTDGLDLTQGIIYNNLIPETTYHFHIAAFNEMGSVIDSEIVDVTTKPLYNISTANASVVDFFAFYNGISLNLANSGYYYLVAYPKDQIPTDEDKIKKDAIANGIIEWTNSIYATNLVENKN